MNPDQKFQQPWEYRRKDDDADPSSDNSKSNSGDEPAQKKHKYLSDLVLPERDEESDTPRSLQSNRLNVAIDFTFQIAEANKKHCGSGRKKLAVVNRSKRNSTKKRKRKANHTNEPAQLADLKIFAESLLEELKVARHTMFVQMKEQITNLVVKSALRTKGKEGKTAKAIHQNENGSGMKTQIVFSGLIERPMKSCEAFDSNKCFKAFEKRTNHKQAPLSNGMEKTDNLSLPVKKPVNDSDQTASSSYLILPSILSKPQIESSRTEFSASDQIHAGCAMNSTDIFGMANFLTDAHSHHGYLPGVLPDEPFERISQISSKSKGLFDQQSNQMPSMNPGLQVPFHQWPNNCFSITSQIVLETPGQENNSIGLMMNTGGITLSDSFVTNTGSCNVKNNTDAGLVSFRSQDIKGKHSFLK